MKCDYCGKGRPKLWNKDGKFCDEECYRKWRGTPAIFPGIIAILDHEENQAK